MKLFLCAVSGSKNQVPMPYKKKLDFIYIYLL